MRDPSKYLLGVYGSFHTWNDIAIWRAAGEAELYHGASPLTGLAGVEGIDGTAQPPTSAHSSASSTCPTTRPRT